LTRRMKLPTKLLPHASVMRSPGAAESNAPWRFPPAATLIVLPVVGVVLIAVLSNFGDSTESAASAGTDGVAALANRAVWIVSNPLEADTAMTSAIDLCMLG